MKLANGNLFVAVLIPFLVVCLICQAGEIHQAAASGDVEMLKKLMAANGALVNQRDSDGQTALHRAAAGGNLAAVQFLVEHAAEVDARSKAGMTPLALAKGFGRTEVVEYLTRSLASHDASPKSAPNQPQKKQTLVDFYNAMDRTFRSGTAAEKKKAGEALLITREDIQQLCPLQVARAWELAQEQNKELIEHLERMSGMFPNDEGAITNIVLKPAGEQVQSLRKGGAISGGVPVYCLDVFREQSMTSTYEFYYVNGRWILFPGATRILSRGTAR